MHFQKLGLIDPLVRAVRSEGYVQPTAIQERSIPHVLAGKDLLGCAQTGTGKTAAFALPIIQRLHGPVVTGRTHARPIRALIVGPTRELAAQIGQSFAVYGKHAHLRHTVIFGGVGQGPQAQALREGVDILVATPGRLLDLHGQHLVNLKHVEILVLDEADRMLDMGFIHDIRRIIAQIPAKRQTLLFSATMPPEILTLANTVLHHPVEVRVPAESPAADTVEQCLYFVDKPAKVALLEHVLKNPDVTRALVFTRTKHGADKVVRCLIRAGLSAAAIHSNKSQGARTRALDSFKRGQVLALVASDIAARGLDVDSISHVINFDLPAEAETYVHRIGRTGRAGARGQAISFCSPEQRDELKGVERLLGRRIPILEHGIKAPAGAAQAHSPRPESSAHGSHPHARPGQGGGSHRHGGALSHPRQGGGSHGSRSAGASHGGHPRRADSDRPAQGGASHRGPGGGGPTHRPAGPGGSRRRNRRKRRW